MQFSEQSGTFYLGQRVQRNGELLANAPLAYDARDLTTHAVCVGMTGCGKTGLGIVLVEEAALNGIPTLVVDPKGDMANLLLAFPDLRPADFQAWVDVEGARRRGLTLKEYAQEVAQSWQGGLARWGIDSERIAHFKESAEFVVYTPGSDAGRSVNILESLHVPLLDWGRDAETLRETISSTVSALLALVGVESDPVTGREHILLATIVEQAWRMGQDMDLAQLITQVQKPPVDHLGVLPVEVFYPESDRMGLALALNGLLASPRFAAWMDGDPLSVDTMLRARDGRPRVSIFSLSHLDEPERFFFVTLLLERVRAWLRLQQGTPDLRAMLYFDELYGFMPPHPANPPTKALLLTLLKRARSQGMGLALATQNPMDLDYKGLSNAGTWFVGKLQTANDRQRVLEGLSGASLEAGVVLDRSALHDQIAALDGRTFLLHNVHGDGPTLFRSRHTMSYLRGPLTRAQIRQLADASNALPVREARASWTPSTEPVMRAAEQRPLPVAEPPVTIGEEPMVITSAIPPAQVVQPAISQEPPPSAWDHLPAMPPVLPSGIRQYFLPVQVPLEWAVRSAEADGRMIIYRDKQLVYRPALLGQAQVRIESTKHNIHDRLVVTRVVEVPEDSPFVAWDDRPLPVQVGELDSRPAQGARFAPLPAPLSDVRRLNASEKDFEEYVYRETSLELPYHTLLKLTARPDETPSQFKRRCYQEIGERRDAEVHTLEKSYQTKIDRLEARIRREERELEQDDAEYEARKREELISAGESVLNVLRRRRQSRMLTTASRKRRLTEQARAEVDESLEAIEDLENQIGILLDDLEREKTEIQSRWAEAADDIETMMVRPRKADIYVEEWGIAWVPYWDVIFDDRGIEQQLSLPAFEPQQKS
jgi:hypothetical protein